MESAAWTVENVLKALALAGGAGAFIASLLQYRKSQRWKRAEWVAQEMKGFLAAPLVQAAMQMIDYPDRRVLLFPERENVEDRYRDVTDQVVREALRAHDATRPFTRDELAIRDAFDSFLDGLERLNSYVQTRLIVDGDVRPYLDYWAGRVLSPDPTDGAVDRLLAVRRYMERYGYRNATALLLRLKETAPTGVRRLTSRRAGWRPRRPASASTLTTSR